MSHHYPMPAGYAGPSDEQTSAITFRRAVPPEPKRYAQCRNCKHFGYDASEYCNSKGAYATRRVNLRCTQHRIVVQMGTVCDGHAFANADRSDR